MAIEEDQHVYRLKVRMALGVMAAGGLMIIGFALVALLTDLNGATGIALGILYVVMSAAYGLWAYRKGRSAS
jgi:hypothetical protein